MANPKNTLLKLNKNLNILQEREAKYGGNAPLELLNQIDDHRRAIELTEQAINGELSEAEWQEALRPLLLAVENGQVVKIEAQTYIAGDVTGDVVGRDKIVNNITHIINQALSAVDEAEKVHSAAQKRLAEGVTDYAQRLQAIAMDERDADAGGPYKGLLAYRLNDAELFFGRGQAKTDLLHRLKRGSLTVLHSQSGAGKSSLLQAGISPQLIAQGHLPVYLRAVETRSKYNIPPRDATTAELKARSSVKSRLEYIPPHLVLKRVFLPEMEIKRSEDTTTWILSPKLANASLRDFLRQVTGALNPQTTLFLLLDQFEEVFTLLTEADRADFIDELADCLADPTLMVRWVLALRSEFFSDLADFPQIENPFANEYRLNRLRPAEARQVIVAPAERQGIAFEPALVESLLAELRDEKGELSPPQIQLVCSALYNLLLDQPPIITQQMYESQGRAGGILRGYLNQVLRTNLPTKQERDLARRLLIALVSSDRRRLRRSRSDLAAQLAIGITAVQSLDSLLEQLVKSRLLNVAKDEEADETSYELIHDYLVTEIELSPEEQARKAAEELLKQEVATYQRHGSLLDVKKYEVINSQREFLILDETAAELLRLSQETLEAEAREKEAQRQRELEQAQKLAAEAEARQKAEADRAREAEGRAKEAEARQQAEKQRAQEAQARQQAEAQARQEADARTKEQTQAAARLRKRAWIAAGIGGVAVIAAVIAIVAALAAAIFGVQSQQHANLAATRAEEAKAAKETAEAERTEAEHQRNLADAQRLVAEGQLQFENNPLLGLRLALEGWYLASPDRKQGIEPIIIKFMRQGRLFKFGVNDVQWIGRNDDNASFWIISRSRANGEFYNLASHQITTLLDEINQVYFSPDANYVVIDYKNTAGVLYRSKSGDFINLMSGVEEVGFSHDGVVIKYRDKSGAVYHPSGTDLVSMNSSIDKLFTNPDINYAVISYEGKAGVIYYPSDNRSISLKDSINNVEFSPNGTHAIIRYSDNTYKLYNSTRETFISLPPLPAGQVIDQIEFSTDDNYAIVSSSSFDGENNRTYTLYKVADSTFTSIAGQPIYITAPDSGLQHYFTPNNTYIVISDENGKGALHHLATDNDIPLAGEIDRITFSLDEAYAVIDYNNTTDELYDLIHDDFIPLPNEVQDVNFTAMYAIIHWENDLSMDIVRLSSRNFFHLEGVVLRLSFSPDETYAIVSFRDKPDMIYRPFMGDLTLLGVDLGSYSPGYSPDSSVVILHDIDLATNYARGAVIMYPQEQNKEKIVLPGTIDQYEFSQDGTYLLVRYYGLSKTQLWQIQQGYSLLDLGSGITFRENSYTVNNFYLDSNTKRLTIWYPDGRAYLIDLTWLEMTHDDRSGEALIEMACWPFQKTDFFDEKDDGVELQKYLGEREPQACR